MTNNLIKLKSFFSLFLSLSPPAIDDNEHSIVGSDLLCRYSNRKKYKSVLSKKKIHFEMTTNCDNIHWNENMFQRFSTDKISVHNKNEKFPKLFSFDTLRAEHVFFIIFFRTKKWRSEINVKSFQSADFILLVSLGDLN